MDHIGWMPLRYTNLIDLPANILVASSIEMAVAYKPYIIRIDSLPIADRAASQKDTIV
jgi:hypothetical protein